MRSSQPTPEVTNAITETIKSAKRLSEDAQYLYEFSNFPTAYSLFILAQEEYAKAFLLHLVVDGALPWDIAVQRALRSHACKQLVALILDFLEREEFFEVYRKQTWTKRISEVPQQVVDSVQLLINEFVYRRKREDWWDPANRPLDPLAQKVAQGMRDREKQNGLYVQIAFNGTVASSPFQITKQQCEVEFDRAKRLDQAVFVADDGKSSVSSLDYDNVKAIFQLLTGSMSQEEFENRW